MSLWFYKRPAIPSMHGLQSLPDRGRVSSAPPNSVYDSTACAGLGWPLCWAYDVSQACSPLRNPVVPEWTVDSAHSSIATSTCHAWPTYTVGTGWLWARFLGVPSGDLFRIVTTVQWLCVCTRCRIAANTITTLKIPMGVFGMTP